MTEAGKAEISQVEAAHEPPSAENGYHIDSDIEKRLVRKLDRKLIPLVMVLCE